MIDYQGKNIVIIGLGITGLSCVNYFLKKNIIPKVIDTRSTVNDIELLDSQVEYHLGSLHESWILNADLLVLSPGISLQTPLLILAKEQGIEIVGDIELFCREVNQLENKKIAAITGSNGKTTVTTLVGDIVKASGKAVSVGGNIGKPALSLLQDESEIFVLELSSFQLETTYDLQASAATILNISEDHMDRYPNGLSEYTAAKQTIYHGARNCIINYDDPLTYPQNEGTLSRIEFGLHCGKYHLDASCRYLMVDDKPIIDTNEIPLFGIHNYLNVLAALAITESLGIERAVAQQVISQFKGLSHRFELVHEQDGVKWINDSKATNVGSTEAALKSVIYHNRLFLLLGGDGKSADFSSLATYLDNKHIYIYCFGQDREALAAIKPEKSVMVKTLKEAMLQIAKVVMAGDVVLLSPACASLDQFKNYIERGHVFTQLAKELTT